MTRWFAGLRVALRSMVRRSRVEDELNEEIEYHLEREIAERVSAGLAPEDARNAALRAMGAIEKSKEEARDLRSGNLVSEMLGDLRYAGRTLRRSPGFATLAILIMALGIGANTAVFSVVNAVLLRPLPYPGSDRIVVLRTSFLTNGTNQTLVSIANFRDWRDLSSSFEAMASYRPGESAVTSGADQAEYGRTASVDAQFFRVFAVEPIIGRTFTQEEMVPGAVPVLIGHDYWQTRFGGDPGILDRTIRVGNNVRPIVGVLPAGFQFPGRTDLWLPQTTRSTSRTGHNFFAVGRLKPAVSPEQAQADLSAVAARLEQQYPESNQGRGVTAGRLQDELVGDVRLTLYLLWGVVGLVLLIACANTATLLISKATARTREMAVRSALGASRPRIIRQLITESLLLALVAGAFGMLFADWAATALVALTPADVVRMANTRLDRSVLVFTLVVSVVTSVLFGLVPALHTSNVNLIDALKQAGTRSVTAGGLRTRGVLVVTEVALAVVLLTGAGLLMKSLITLHNVELGFEPQNVLVMKATGVQSMRENNGVFADILSRIAALPGVVAVGATSTPPGDLSNAGSGFHYLDRMPEHRDRTIEPNTLHTIVAPGTFAALGIPLKSGRDFNDGDTGDRPLVAVVNETLVRQSLAGENPIGRTIFCPFDRMEGMTIVGVVGDVRQRNPAMAPEPECYMPYQQHSYNNSTLNVVARTTGDPTSFVSTIRRVVAEVSPDVPASFTTMAATVSERVEDPRFRAILVAIFALLAVSLAMAGVYGVMRSAVEQRSKEIALRMALGADRGSVMRHVLGQGMMLGAVGLIFGLAGAAVATQLLTSVLFEVRSLDVPVYLGVVVILGAVTLVAGYLPARRASILDPVEVLKAE